MAAPSEDRMRVRSVPPLKKLTVPVKNEEELQEPPVVKEQISAEEKARRFALQKESLERLTRVKEKPTLDAFAKVVV